MQIVLVGFAVGDEKAEACLSALETLMRTEVAKQPTLHGATIHEEKATGTVWNLMRGDTHQDLIDFREGSPEMVGAALCELGPQSRMLDAAFTVETTGG